MCSVVVVASPVLIISTRMSILKPCGAAVAGCVEQFERAAAVGFGDAVPRHWERALGRLI
jgi:hypothetical protein